VRQGLIKCNGGLPLTGPNFKGQAFAKAVKLVGSWTLAPCAVGNLELPAAAGTIGLSVTGPGQVNGRTMRVWTSSRINLSDASPASIPDIAAPLAYQSAIGRDRNSAVQSRVSILNNVTLALSETGSYLGSAGTSLVKQALHSAGLLHLNDANPVRLYATGGDITGLTLFTPKASRIIARRDITDVSFYLQHVSASDVTLVSAGRDILPFNETSQVRNLANNPGLGNHVGDTLLSTVTGDSTNAMAGDIQINGPGLLEVLGGRNIDLGTGANFSDGTGLGITSIGNIRNPNLPFSGADLIALAAVSGADGASPAGGLSTSSLDFDAFINQYINVDSVIESPYLEKLGITAEFSMLTDEQQAVVSLERFYQILRDTGRNYQQLGNYDAGVAAVAALFGEDNPEGDILTRAREIRTVTGGSISLGVPGGGITMASAIFGNPLTPPGIVTEYGGTISTFTDGDVSIGQARIFTLRGGDIVMWSSTGNIAAGTSPRTVVTAPPTRVVIDITSADVQTDLGGPPPGGGIGVLAAVQGVEPGNVDLIAPQGFVDAGDAGIRVTGNLNIAAVQVLNSANISAAGTTTGSSVSAPAPSVAAVASASNAAAATTASATKPEEAQQDTKPTHAEDQAPSIYTVEVIGYGGGSAGDEEEKEDEGGKEKKTDQPRAFSTH